MDASWGLFLPECVGGKGIGIGCPSHAGRRAAWLAMAKELPDPQKGDNHADEASCILILRDCVVPSHGVFGVRLRR